MGLQAELFKPISGKNTIRTRFCDPGISKFVQPDTIIPNLYNPQDLNRYSYSRNNPIKYSDPSGHMVSECGGKDANECSGTTQSEIDLNIRKEALWLATNEQLKCNAGNKNHCSYAENHPVETAIAIVGGLTGGVAVENFVLGGGAATAVDTAYLAIKPALMPLYAWLSTFFTHNPDAQTVSIGSYDKYGVNGYIEVGNTPGNVMTYFSIGNQTVYNILDNLGLAEPINEGFMLDQISQAKSFAGTLLTAPGPGYLLEIQMLTESGYTQLSSGLTGFSSYYQPPAIWP